MTQENPYTIEDLVKVHREKAETPPLPVRPKNTFRRRRYVDFVLQMRMLLALVAMETGLVAGGLFYLYIRFDAIINNSLYRIHQRQGHGPFLEMLQEVGLVILVIVVINLLAWMFANWIWVRFVQSVLTPFNLMLDRMSRLDMQEDRGIMPKHESLDRMLSWRQKERRRMLMIKAYLAGISLEGDLTKADVRSNLQNRFRKIRRILPPHSRRILSAIKEFREARLPGFDD
ncbi:MAG: hypothetical protein H7832_08630 [Magnetococcus sp. DMHC-6]